MSCCGIFGWLLCITACVCVGVSVVEVSGQDCLCSLVFRSRRVLGGVLGLGTGSCFGSILVRVLTSLVRRPWLLTGLQTILVVQETCAAKPNYSCDTHTRSCSHTYEQHCGRSASAYIHTQSCRDDRIAFFQTSYKVLHRGTRKSLH